MKRNKIWIVPFLSIILITAVSIFYLNAIKNSMWEQAVASIFETTVQGSHSFDIYLSKDTEWLHHMTLNFSQMDSQDEKSIQSDLKHMSELESNYLVVNLEKGVLYSNHNENPVKLNSAELDKYSSYNGCIISEPDISNFTGLRVLSCYENFRFSDGTKGVVQSEHPVSLISEEFSLSFYNDEGYSNIINRDGKILVRSDNVKNNRTFNNIFDIIDYSGNDDENLHKFQVSLSEGKSGAVHFKYRNEDYVYTYVPLESTDGWYLVSIIPNVVIMKNSSEIIKDSWIFFVIIILNVSVFVAFALTIIYTRRQLKKKDGEIKCHENLFDIFSKDTNEVFLMLSADNFSVEYVSPNVERILGIPSRTVKSNLKSLGTAVYSDGHNIDYKFLSDMEKNSSIRLEGHRVQRVSGESRLFSENIQRISFDKDDKFVITIKDITENNPD